MIISSAGSQEAFPQFHCFTALCLGPRTPSMNPWLFLRNNIQTHIGTSIFQYNYKFITHDLRENLRWRIKTSYTYILTWKKICNVNYGGPIHRRNYSCLLSSEKKPLKKRLSKSLISQTAYWWTLYSAIRPKNRPTKSTNNRPPWFPVKWHITKSCRRLHVRHARPSPTPWANSGGRLAAPHLSCLVDEKTETNHGDGGAIFRWSLPKCLEGQEQSRVVGWAVAANVVLVL